VAIILHGTKFSGETAFAHPWVSAEPIFIQNLEYIFKQSKQQLPEYSKRDPVPTDRLKALQRQLSVPVRDKLPTWAQIDDLVKTHFEGSDPYCSVFTKCGGESCEWCTPFDDAEDEDFLRIIKRCGPVRNPHDSGHYYSFVDLLTESAATPCKPPSRTGLVKQLRADYLANNHSISADVLTDSAERLMISTTDLLEYLREKT